jgi:hypothetical protein
MNTRPSLYRSTLIAAAVAIGCFGAATAQAHDHGWRGHDADRGWHGRDRGWHEHEWREHEWREHEWRDRDGYRGYGHRYGHAEPVWREGWAEYAPPPVAYYPAPAAFPPGGVSVVVRLPF